MQKSIVQNFWLGDLLIEWIKTQVDCEIVLSKDVDSYIHLRFDEKVRIFRIGPNNRWEIKDGEIWSGALTWMAYYKTQFRDKCPSGYTISEHELTLCACENKK